MDEHPLVRFTDGPSGRRARLVGTGKDIWEIIAVIRDNCSARPSPASCAHASTTPKLWPGTQNMRRCPTPRR
jgi:hypothetical protein